MPHFLTSRDRYMPAFISEFCSGLKTPSRRESASYAYLIEALDLIAAIIFVIGSVCFLPRYSKNIEIFICGCNMFVVGSVQYVVICCLTFAEAWNEKGTWSFEAFENLGWIIGSAIFLIGTILYFPDRETCDEHVKGHKGSHKGDEVCSSLAQHVNNNMKEWLGTVFFIVGSMIFVIAVFFNAMNQRKFSKWHHQMVSLITFNYMLGSLLFCMGSVAFLPNSTGCGANMAALGAWMFIAGSVFFVIGSLSSLYRTYSMLNSVSDDLDSSQEFSREALASKLEDSGPAPSS